jgi:hypothetical protein
MTQKAAFSAVCVSYLTNLGKNLAASVGAISPLSTSVPGSTPMRQICGLPLGAIPR